MKLNGFMGSCFGTVGFVLAILAGLHANNGFDTIVTRALVALVSCYIGGYVIGAAATYIVVEHAQQLAATVAQQDADALVKKELEAAERAAEAAAKAPAKVSPAV